MAYDKPKVTIDLDQYNELIEIKQKANSEDNLLMAKQILISIIRAEFRPERFKDFLLEYNIGIVTPQTLGYSFDIENVAIKRIKK